MHGQTFAKVLLFMQVLSRQLAPPLDWKLYLLTVKLVGLLCTLVDIYRRLLYHSGSSDLITLKVDPSRVYRVSVAY